MGFSKFSGQNWTHSTEACTLVQGKSPGRWPLARESHRKSLVFQEVPDFAEVERATRPSDMASEGRKLDRSDEPGFSS